MAAAPGAQVATASGPIPACPSGQPPSGTCAETNFNAPPNSPCGGGWFIAVRQAQLSTQYSFSADQAPCASGKPMVVVSAAQFAGGGSPVTGTSVTQSEAGLGTVTWSVSTSNNWSSEVQNRVLIQYNGTGGGPGPGPGGNLNAFDSRLQSGSVGADVDMVPSTQSLSGARSWQFGLGDFGSEAVAGAQITVHGGGNPALNSSAAFDWRYQLTAGQGPPPSVPQPCVSTATDVSCPPAGVPLTSGSGLQAFSSGHPGPGGPG